MFFFELGEGDCFVGFEFSFSHFFFYEFVAGLEVFDFVFEEVDVAGTEGVFFWLVVDFWEFFYVTD